MADRHEKGGYWDEGHGSSKQSASPVRTNTYMLIGAGGGASNASSPTMGQGGNGVASSYIGPNGPVGAGSCGVGDVNAASNIVTPLAPGDINQAANQTLASANHASSFYGYDSLVVVYDPKSGAYEMRCSAGLNVTMLIGLLHRITLGIHKAAADNSQLKEPEYAVGPTD